MNGFSHTAASATLYAISPYTVSPRLIRAVATVKEAAARCNGNLGYLTPIETEHLVRACKELRVKNDEAIVQAFPIDAYQGGAGTSTNMAVNEWLASAASETAQERGVSIDALDHANAHQSTNDVMPTALRLMMHDHFVELERETEALQNVLQLGEAEFEDIQKPARTQLREALVTTMGRQYATWSHAIGRDRWRCFKARERIREVNLGGTAIGTGAGAPRSYVLSVVPELQRIVDHPVCRADHLGEAKSNYDQVIEAMDVGRTLSVNLRRIASDIRLLSSGPHTGIGELTVPPLIEGSSIMAGKVNPVVPEAIVQSSERVLSNIALISRLASQSELELNAFFPGIAHAVDESLIMLRYAVSSLRGYIERVAPDRSRCERGLRDGYSTAVALLPLITYREVELLVEAARLQSLSLDRYLVDSEIIDREEADELFHPRNLVSLGYNESLYAEIGDRTTTALRDHIALLCRRSEDPN